VATRTVVEVGLAGGELSNSTFGPGKDDVTTGAAGAPVSPLADMNAIARTLPASFPTSGVVGRTVGGGAVAERGENAANPAVAKLATMSQLMKALQRKERTNLRLACLDQGLSPGRQ